MPQRVGVLGLPATPLPLYAQGLTIQRRLSIEPIDGGRLHGVFFDVALGHYGAQDQLG